MREKNNMTVTETQHEVTQGVTAPSSLTRPAIAATLTQWSKISNLLQTSAGWCESDLSDSCLTLEKLSLRGTAAIILTPSRLFISGIQENLHWVLLTHKLDFCLLFLYKVRSQFSGQWCWSRQTSRWTLHYFFWESWHDGGRPCPHWDTGGTRRSGWLGLLVLLHVIVMLRR